MWIYPVDCVIHLLNNHVLIYRKIIFTTVFGNIIDEVNGWNTEATVDHVIQLCR